MGKAAFVVTSGSLAELTRRGRRKRFLLESGAALVFCIGLWGGRAATGELPVVRWQGRTMGSPYTVQVVGVELKEPQLEDLKREVEERLREVNRQMSHYDPESELSRFNRAPADVPFKVSPELARVVRFSLAMHRDSHGAFDPTLGPVINLWGFGEKSETRAVPAEAALREAVQKTGARHLTVTDKDELIKKVPELTLNLSAVAKGFGVDEMVRVLRGHGLTNAYASIAGDVAVRGHNARGTAWQLGVAAPIEHWRETDPMAAVLSLADRALSTSGDYQKFFTDAQGRRLSHIINPRTGWPVQHSVTGVSVVAADSTTADALSTTLFVMGHEEGLRFIEARSDAAALFILREAEGKYRLLPSSRWPR
jgi:thiamine biosynthesis lipoprotein